MVDNLGELGPKQSCATVCVGELSHTTFLILTFQQGTYISQLIRYSRACHNYDSFFSRHSMLAERLFNKGFSARKVIRTFYKFIGGYPKLAPKFNKSPSSMIYHSAPMAQLYHAFPQLMK